MPKCSALFTSDTSVHHCHHFRAAEQPSAARQPKAALDAKRPIVLFRPGIEPRRSSDRNWRSLVVLRACGLFLGDPGHEVDVLLDEAHEPRVAVDGLGVDVALLVRDVTLFLPPCQYWRL